MADGPRRSVLLVEDDRQLRDTVIEILGISGIDAKGASSATEAEEIILAGWRPDLVMLDLHGVASPLVARALRKMTPRPVIVLVSGDNKVAEFAADMGADAWLAKPYDVDDLLNIIDRLISGGDHVELAAPTA